ncbi:hypothetical protein DFR70_101607 [Nocardia tenerifensis]|uniref:Uncharacterized protein n=1 Tax=Nocardia tenerifensis TaxID=228006 RepID=A0A318KE37_9NOCA|nr:hypothetical protein [Nocardia tenerifensis]PXX71185.1 hypothetical protein DFR70_101607 [Nocardia tenerifensis]
MDSEDRETQTPSRVVTAWTVGLGCVAIVACGVIVGGLLHEREPELTTAPVVATSTSAAEEPPDLPYITPPVVFPTQIPGCPVVEPPRDGAGMSFISADHSVYDNPDYPWFSGPKAVDMSQALRDALPRDVAIGFAPVEQSLLFEPIFDPETEPGETHDFGGWTTAHATLTRGGKWGTLMVSVKQSTAPIPPCVAGDLDERRHLADGTTVDVHDTWHELGGVRTLTHSAYAYLPDGTVVTTSASDDGRDDAKPSGKVPLTVDELAAMATAPGLRVTAPVPPGTPDVPESCNTGTESGGTIDEAVARRLDAVLAGIPLDGLSLDRPLGGLRPAGYLSSGVCQAVRVTTPGQRSRLNVGIAVGQKIPVDPPVGHGTSRTLPDGTVVENQESHSMKSSNEQGPPAVEEATRTVTVTHRSGTLVRVSSSAEYPEAPLPFDRLEAIAVTPGLEVK